MFLADLAKEKETIDISIYAYKIHLFNKISFVIAFLKMKAGFYTRYIIYKINSAREYVYLKSSRRKLRNKDFTIISNNCWGGSIYEDLGLSYATPTVGLFFFAPCYIKFLSDLKNNLYAPLEFVKQSQYEKGRYLQSLHPYPIGLINGDIEIHFLHFNSEADALEKWTRRAARVNFENLFLSFSDNETCSIDQIKAFDLLPYKKVFFSARKITGISSLVFLRSYSGQPGIGNIYDNRWEYRRYFNTVKWLNSI